METVGGDMTPDPDLDLEPLRARLADVQRHLSDAIESCKQLGRMASQALMARDQALNPRAASHESRRGSDVEAWIKRHRELYGRTDDKWHAIDYMLDDYRDHADTGTPLDREVQGPHSEED
jgi:hypothetical protein